MPQFDGDASAFEVDNMSLNLVEAVGEVSSYFTYYGCPIKMKGEMCKMEEMALYVVLTDLHPLAED